MNATLNNPSIDAPENSREDKRYSTYATELQAIFTGTPLMRLAISMENAGDKNARSGYLRSNS